MNSTLMGAETGLILYYKFDEGSGSVAVNSATATGSALDGALFNSAMYGSSSPLGVSSSVQ